MRRRAADPQTQFQRAVYALQRGQYQQALRRLERLLAVAPDDPVWQEQVHLVMADAYLSLRDLDRAVQYATRAIELNPDSERGYYLLGFTYSIQNDWAQAVPALRRAFESDPEEPEYHRALGWALYNQGETKEGQRLLEKALHLDPTQVTILTDLAMLKGQEQSFDEAIHYARRAAQLAPSDPMVQEILASLTHFKREFERLGGQAGSQPPAKPQTEAEWREVIAATDNFNQVVQLWFDTHPAKDIDEANASLNELRELWNSTPRPELGGRSPNEMMNRPPKT